MLAAVVWVSHRWMFGPVRRQSCALGSVTPTSVLHWLWGCPDRSDITTRSDGVDIASAGIDLD